MIESDFLESGTSFLVQSQSIVKQNPRNPRVVCTPIQPKFLLSYRELTADPYFLLPQCNPQKSIERDRKRNLIPRKLLKARLGAEIFVTYFCWYVSQICAEWQSALKKTNPIIQLFLSLRTALSIKTLFNISYFQVLQEVFDGGNKENVEKEPVTRDFLVLETSTQFFWCYDDTVHAK